MADLVTSSLEYISQNLQAIILLPIDMSCMNSPLVKRLAKICSLDVIENLVDKKDKLTSKLFMKRLEAVLETNELNRCVNCNLLFTKE